jgi:cadmium resistance protein CadD (predicted permease)
MSIDTILNATILGLLVVTPIVIGIEYAIERRHRA